jgi:hypothetical protein
MIYKTRYVDVMGMKGHFYPKLPSIEVNNYKTRCMVTDIRYLNEKAVVAIERIIKTVATGKNCEQVSFNMTGIEENEIDLINDILGGIRIEATKRGVGSGVTSITGSTERKVIESNDKEKHITETFYINPYVANAIYEYAQEHEEINYFDLMCYVGAQMFEKMGAN